MNDIPGVEIRVEALMDEIRDEVVRRNRRGPQTRESYTLSEFLCFDDEEFIRNAYLRLLRRDPDSDGLTAFRADLRTRRSSKLEILELLLRSPEGRAAGAHIVGLPQPPACVVKPKINPRTPAFFGGIAQKAYSVQDFLEFQDDEFVRGAYLGILRREPDQQGYEHFLRSLRSGRLARIEILGRLRYSKEGRAAAVPIRGLAARFGLRVIRRVPIVGPVLGIIQYVVRLPAWMRNLERLEADLHFQRRVTEQIEARLSTGNEQLQAELESLSGDVATTRQLAQLAEGIARLTTISETLSSRQDSLTPRFRVEELEREVQSARRDAVTRAEYEHLIASLEQKVSQERLSDVVDHIAGLVDRKPEKAQLDAVARQVTVELQEVRSSLDVLHGQTLDYRADLHDQQRRLVSFRKEIAEQLLQLTREHAHASTFEAGQMPDAFYASFEDRFRGTHAEVKERFQVYLPAVRAAGAGTAEAPILDIGCGRGEWLELLKENDLTARGVDLNHVMIDRCRQRELDVIEDDAVEYLRGQRKDSLGAVTGMHVIEHISFTKLRALLDETRRVLKSGGIAIFETPNPENLMTGACNFYLDPTHMRPLPPESTKFVVEERGFSRVEILRLHPYPVEAMLTDGTIELRERINHALYGPQDYAILAFKA